MLVRLLLWLSATAHAIAVNGRQGEVVGARGRIGSLLLRAGGGSLAVAPLRHVVDWGAVQAELARLAPEFQNARFESLPHVVEVLSSVDPEQTLREVRRPGPPPPPGS